MGPKPEYWKILDNDAYVRIFDEILNEIDHNLCEKNSIRIYQLLSLEARYLLTRLYCRQVRWVRRSELLNYLSPEILEEVLTELAAAKAIEQGRSVEELCAVASVKELTNVAQHFGIRQRLAGRSVIVNSIKSLVKQKRWFGGPFEPKIQARLELEIGGGHPVVLSGWILELFKRLESMFLYPAGGVGIDVMVRANMGLLRFPEYNYIPQKDAPIFADRDAFESWFLAHQICFPLEDANSVDSEVLDMVREGLLSTTGLAARTYGRAAFKISQILAKMHDFQAEYDWLDIYINQTAHRSKLGEAIIRKILLEIRLWKETKSPSWLHRSLNSYYEAEIVVSEIERIDLERKGTKLWRELKLANVSAPPLLQASKKFSVHECEIRADLQSSSTKSRTKWGIDHCTVEEAALEHYSRDSWEGMHLENSSIHTLFWLSVSDLIFSQVSQFRCRFQSAPLSIQDSINDIRVKERLNNSRLAQIIIENREALSKDGFPQIIGINWDIPETALRSIITGLDSFLGPVLEHLRSNYRLYQSGFPDLTLWNHKEVSFVEVKSTKDTLSDNQRCWLQFLLELGVRVEICRVKNN